MRGGGFSSENVWISDSEAKEERREAALAWPGLETASSVVGGGKESRKFLLITEKTSIPPLPSALQMFAKTLSTLAAVNEIGFTYSLTIVHQFSMSKKLSISMVFVGNWKNMLRMRLKRLVLVCAGRSSPLFNHKK